MPVRELWFFLLEYARSVSWPDVIKRRLNQGYFGFVRFSFLGLLVYIFGFLVFILVVVGLFCQYHSQVIGWKDSSPK